MTSDAASLTAAAATRTCPKSMLFGPCGGVGSDGGCEVDGRRCPFCDLAGPPPWKGRPHRPRPIALPRFLVDVGPTDDDDELTAIGALLADLGAAALVGEHVDDRSGRPMPEMVDALTGQGTPTVATVTARSRDVAGHREAIHAVAASGAVVVHCVTGDHPAARSASQASARFTLDGTRLAGIARAEGVAVSVAESPASPPVDWRPARLGAKQAAGADLAVLNHAGHPHALVRFARRCRDTGVDLAIVPPVPVLTDRDSAHALEQFPGLELPPGLARRVVEARNPRRAGIAAAVDLTRILLAESEFDTVNLSGSASGAGSDDRYRVIAEILARVDAA